MRSHLDRHARLALLVVATALVGGALASAASGHVVKRGTAAPDFGPNVKIFDPSMSTSDDQGDRRRDRRAAGLEPVRDASATRCSSCPAPTELPTDPLNFQVGYYTEVAGLGSSPNDVTVNGTIDSYNQCFGPSDCTALVNFWRSVSNLTINVAGKDGCQSGEFWATSQAAPMRRVHVNGFATLMDYCSGPSFASGGFIADSQFSGSTVVNGSQQQYLVRNSDLDGWTNGVWNQVFAGVKGAPAQSFPNPPYTTLDTNPASREKPFLYVDANRHFNVFVPDAQFNSSGTTWANGQTPGHSLPIESFFIAKPTDSVQSINNALSRGKNLIFTPGVYDIDKTIKVKRPDTIVLGLGMATLTAQNGVIPMTVADVKGVEISGLIFDAGTQDLAGAAAVRQISLDGPATATAARERRERPGRAPRRVLPHRRPARRQGVHEPRRRPRQHDPRRHLGVARRPRQRRRLDDQHRRHRRRRHRRQRRRDRPLRRALPEVRRLLGRRERQDDHVPERDAVRPAEPGGVAAQRRPRVGRLQGRRLGQDPRRRGASGATASSTSIPRSTRAAPSRCP